MSDITKDELAYSVWKNKYAAPGETHPDEMHLRMAKEVARIEERYIKNESGFFAGLNRAKLSNYGSRREPLTLNRIFSFFKDFKLIVPQGSIMASLGRRDIVSSLSNCFVIGQPEDSYGGILQKDQEMAQLMKRRGGVGLDISSLRPNTAPVTNSAKSSTGPISFMHRYSNTTREVAQDGRRGALMLSIDCRHPDVFDFVNVKQERDKVTGANISVNLRDDFMKAVQEDDDYILRWPCDLDLTKFTHDYLDANYNELHYIEDHTKNNKVCYLKKIKAKELYDRIVFNAWDNAEPGQMFIDEHWDNSPDGVYKQYKGVTTNPCFHPDTLIETEYGRLKIKDINKPMRVYSMDSGGRLVMSNASASFISKKNAKTLKITLKNGSSIQVTPEHKLWVQDIGWFEAKDLRIGNQLGHLCRSRRGAKYAGVHLTTSPNKQKDQVMEHKLVYGQHEANMNVHHIDRNTYNNSIDNLELLSHSEHSRITALEDNPQTHQERDKLGKFISGENSKYSKKTIVDLPDELKTNILSRYHNMIESIEEGEITDVYDIQVKNTHCLIANNIIAHNCGEIFMGEYDACRLLALNYTSFVRNQYSPQAYFDYDFFYKMAYEQQRIADDIVDLEIEHINRILDKIKSDPESEEVKSAEYSLWEKVKHIASSSRRTGCGFTGLADTLAMLGFKYDSPESLEVIEQISRTKLRAEIDCTTDLAILRGTFKGWDRDLETNRFYDKIKFEFPDEYARMNKYGRRNVSWSTVAPTGTVSLMTQTSSGLEPVFLPYYIRRRKVNPNDLEVRIDFTDQNGDNWQEYPVLHPEFKNWLDKIFYNRLNGYEFNEDVKLIWNKPWTKESLEVGFKYSPWYQSTANDIDWKKRIEIQGIIQEYVTHSISSTLNLPEHTKPEEVGEIYMYAWEQALKGVTVYRDNCRTGVLINDSKQKDSWLPHDAPKRPDVLPVEIHSTTSKGTKWNVIVGLYEERPYEVFAVPHFTNESNLELVKLKKGRYDLLKNKEVYSENVTSEMNAEQEVITRLVSTSLRHGADITFIVEQLNKSNGDITSFSKAIARVLSKYIDQEKFLSRATCQDCGSTDIIFEEGCQKCLNCGSSKCG